MFVIFNRYVYRATKVTYQLVFVLEEYRKTMIGFHTVERAIYRETTCGPRPWKNPSCVKILVALPRSPLCAFVLRFIIIIIIILFCYNRRVGFRKTKQKYPSDSADKTRVTTDTTVFSSLFYHLPPPPFLKRKSREFRNDRNVVSCNVIFTDIVIQTILSRFRTQYTQYTIIVETNSIT